jgi:hypothetical protein
MDVLIGAAAGVLLYLGAYYLADRFGMLALPVAVLTGLAVAYWLG